MNTVPESGIGVVYFRDFEPFLERHARSLDVIELEPQTLWYNTGSKGAFGIDETPHSFLRGLGLPLIFHGVGAPVAGSRLPPAEMIRTLKEHITQLQPLSFSEHLSFNTFREGGSAINTSFLLPPLQNEQGINAVLRNINHYKDSLQLPFAFETGVNYLKPLKGEIEDGRFVREIAERADCSILLDLHNILVNHRNGRQPIHEFLRQLPHERITELHLANGFYHKGYYLDAHSGTASTELIDISLKVARSLPNLKAIIFEMQPDFMDQLPAAAFGRQLQQLRKIWDARGKAVTGKPVKQPAAAAPESAVTVKEWETNLGRLALGRQAGEAAWATEIAADKGLQIIRELIYNFRASALVTSLQLSTRLIRLALGEGVFKEIVSRFFEATPPELFPYKAALRFAKFIKGRYAVRYLDGMLAYEIAGLRARSEGRSRTVQLDFNPFPVIRALSQCELPEDQDAPMRFLLTLENEQEAAREEVRKLEAVYHV